MKQTLHVFVKDVRLHWIEIVATLTVMALFVWIYPSSWADASHRLPVWPWVPGAATALVPISWLVLITRVIHAESLVGERQFWITRPYRWPDLMAAKGLFILAFVYLPFFVAQCLLLRSAGMHPKAYLSGILYNLLLTTGIVVLPMACLAAVTSNFAKMLLGLLAIILFAAGTAYCDELLPASSSTNPFLEQLSYIIPVSVFCAVLVVQYSRRQVVLARTMLAVLAVSIALTGLFGPEDTMMRVTYPVRAASDAPQLTLGPVAASASGAVDNSVDERQVTLVFPVRISGISPETVLRVDNARVAMSGAGNEHWISHWQGQYLMWPSGQTDGAVTLKVSRPFYQRVRDRRVSVDLSLAITMLKAGKVTRLVMPKSGLEIPGGSICGPSEAWTANLSCLSPMRQPKLMMVATRFSTKECSNTPPANDGDFAYGWIGTLDKDPADFGMTSVWGSSAFLQRVSSSTKTERQYVCPGSPISFVSYETTTKRQQTISGQLQNLKNLTPSRF